MIGIVPLALAGHLAFAQPAPEPAEGELYEIDPAASDLHWLVYRAGTLARFGHNHVISVGELNGRVLVAPAIEESQFEIEIPVEDLVVDDAELRAGEGEEFESVPSADDIAGTRENMLSEAVLNAEEYPTIRIVGTGPVVEGGSQSLEVTVELLGRSIPLSIPTEVEMNGDTLEASGSFRLTHEELGMKPFSVMLGALQVGEALDFEYHVVARKSE